MAVYLIVLKVPLNLNQPFLILRLHFGGYLWVVEQCCLVDYRHILQCGSVDVGETGLSGVWVGQSAEEVASRSARTGDHPRQSGETPRWQTQDPWRCTAAYYSCQFHLRLIVCQPRYSHESLRAEIFFAIFLHVVLYSFKTLVFNQGSTEPNVSVSSRQGFLRWPVIVYNNNGWIHQATQIYFWFWLQLQCYTLTPVSISVFSFFTKYRKMLFLSNLNRTNPCITA